MGIKYIVGYNFQGDNHSFNGKSSPWVQCFSTCAWMLISYYTPKVKAGDDKSLAIYHDDVELLVGNPGIAEDVKQKEPWIKGASSQWWDVQRAGITKWLNDFGVKGKARFRDQDVHFVDLPKLIEDKGPVILGTNKLGGLPGGHIILGIGYDETGIFCNDPAGDANESYKQGKGDGVHYDYVKLSKAMGDKIRCIYWEV